MGDCSFGKCSCVSTKTKQLEAFVAASRSYVKYDCASGLPEFLTFSYWAEHDCETGLKQWHIQQNRPTKHNGSSNTIKNKERKEGKQGRTTTYDKQCHTSMHYLQFPQVHKTFHNLQRTNTTSSRCLALITSIICDDKKYNILKFLQDVINSLKPKFYPILALESCHTCPEILLDNTTEHIEIS